MTEVAGRTALVTGGAQGIGLGIARALARAGARVAVVDLDADALDDVAGDVAAVAQVLDVRDRDAFARVVDDVEARLGPISLLINNAGVLGATPVHEMSYPMWDWVLDINVGGVVNGLQTVLPRMVERGEGGHVVNTASVAGVVPADSGYLYSASKFAVVGLTESLHVELAKIKSGICATVLCPSAVATWIIERSINARPDNPRVTNPRSLRRMEAAKEVLANGRHPDAVGEMVLEGIRANAMHVFTDSLAAGLIEARNRSLLHACMHVGKVPT